MKTELVTTLKRQATRIIEDLRADRDPVMITEHGKPAAYLVDVETFEAKEKRMLLLEGLARGEKAFSEGRILNHRSEKENVEMAEVIWAEPALNALDEIADHIALNDYDAASRLVSKVFEKVELLEENHSLGNISKDLKHTPYRRLVIKPVYVYYRSEGENIVIIFVDRNERDFNIARFAR